jgi:uncharacterized membrane protein
MTDKNKQRIGYLDWMRGLACVLMFQTHCYDSWLGGAARQTSFLSYSELGGTLPAPLFLFLAGVSAALVTDRMRQKGFAPNVIARTTMLRGAEIVGFAYLFRLQEFVLGQPWSPWTDLLRVDVLNIIGLSLILLAVTCRVAAIGVATSTAVTTPNTRLTTLLRARSVALATTAAAAVTLFAPPLWTTHRPRFLPWYLESYINGVHTLDKPQPWLFPLFPWAAFAFAGLAIGFLILAPWSVRNQLPTVAACGAAGAAIYFLGQWLDAQPRQIYAVYDFWHTSPEFFLMRLGIILMIILASYVWCRWGAGQWGFNPLIELGQASLLVYWVHIEFVYGRLSIMKKGGEGIAGATLGLAIICVAMTALAYVRNRTKGWSPRQFVAYIRPSHATQ